MSTEKNVKAPMYDFFKKKTDKLEINIKSDGRINSVVSAENDLTSMNQLDYTPKLVADLNASMSTK